AAVLDDLSAIRVFDRQNILDRIEEQLSSEPSPPTRHRKILIGLVPSFQAVPPIRQLTVRAYRVFSPSERERVWGEGGLGLLRFRNTRACPDRAPSGGADPP